MEIFWSPLCLSTCFFTIIDAYVNENMQSLVSLVYFSHFPQLLLEHILFHHQILYLGVMIGKIIWGNLLKAQTMVNTKLH